MNISAQVAEANRQWMEEEDGIIDDCTIIIAFMDQVEAEDQPMPQTPPLHDTAPQPLASVARAMNDIARQKSKVLTHEAAAVHRVPSLTKLTVKVSQ